VTTRSSSRAARWTSSISLRIRSLPPEECRNAPLFTPTFYVDKITEAYLLFGERREGVIKVAIKP